MTEGLTNAPAQEPAPASPRRLAWRIAIGAIQGVALYGVLAAMRGLPPAAPQWLALGPLLLVALLIPPLVVIGLGEMRMSRQVLWAVLLALIVAMLGYHDAARMLWLAGADPALADVSFAPIPARMPTFEAGAVCALFVFVAHTLIAAGERSRTWLAPYDAYFSLAWRLALQVLLAALFVGVFHLVLWAGATLFMLLDLHFLRTLLRQLWFEAPVNALAFALALHVADVRADIVRGLRTLLLTLMSWLLPLLVLIVAGFLLSSALTGFKPLWETRSTAGVLLGVAALEIVLLNAVFKNGAAHEPVPRLLRISARAGSLTLPFLVGAAGYALALRIGQHGLTVQRVHAGALTLLAACYAIGYARAAFARRDWLTAIAPTNVLTAWLSLAVLIALYTPIADPARLSVDSQVQRLLSGRIAPDTFDFAFLRYDAANYGKRALLALRATADGPNAASIREQSRSMIERSRSDGTMTAPTRAGLAAHLVVHTPGQAVPASFLDTDWPHRQDEGLPLCLTMAGETCDVYLADLSGRHTADLLLMQAGSDFGTAFGQDAGGEWHAVARFRLDAGCTEQRDALAHGQYRRVAPRAFDLDVGGLRIGMEPIDTPPVHCKR
ncbi:DUF4153 domain-containing protein [Burkholderia sp. Ac-20379]|uniref:DUF4153 domain-containing protein n=1 Tax=Burkholderia sp. Ac-20379 TaxID=2703900 RepID=UPI00197D99B3|nr:DUF4153 domain-containing protein [Burkholderia sp. Ac-20379]MBN3727592.1 DUF4153 domain-containing protein [Burkholderia sp. Ac-20379]